MGGAASRKEPSTITVATATTTPSPPFPHPRPSSQQHVCFLLPILFLFFRPFLPFFQRFVNIRYWQCIKKQTTTNKEKLVIANATLCVCSRSQRSREIPHDHWRRETLNMTRGQKLFPWSSMSTALLTNTIHRWPDNVCNLVNWARTNRTYIVTGEGRRWEEKVTQVIQIVKQQQETRNDWYKTPANKGNLNKKPQIQMDSAKKIPPPLPPHPSKTTTNKNNNNKRTDKNKF